MRIFLFLLIPITIFAVEETDYRLPGYRATYPMHSLDLHHLSVAAAKTREGHFSFGDTNATVNLGPRSTETTSTNIVVGLRNIYMSLSSNIKPKCTPYAVLGVDSRYTGIENWAVIGNAVIQPDLTHFDLSRRTRYIASIIAARSFTPSITGHIGAYTEFGMKTAILKPIIGLDYVSNLYKIQIIYPIKAGLSYLGCNNQIFSLIARPFRAAVCTHKGLDHKPSIVRYRGAGAEFRWDYISTIWNSWLSLGRTIDGNLTIGDHNNRNKKNMHVKKSPYLQIGFTFRL